MWTVCRPRPSAAKRLSRGMVYPCRIKHINHYHVLKASTIKLLQSNHYYKVLEKRRASASFGNITFAFFQLEMHGGIFHSCCSLTVIYKQKHSYFYRQHKKLKIKTVFTFQPTPTFLLGECITGAGGDGGPLGIFLLILKHTTFTLVKLSSEDVLTQTLKRVPKVEKHDFIVKFYIKVGSIDNNNKKKMEKVSLPPFAVQNWSQEDSQLPCFSFWHTQAVWGFMSCIFISPHNLGVTWTLF